MAKADQSAPMDSRNMNAARSMLSGHSMFNSNQIGPPIQAPPGGFLIGNQGNQRMGQQNPYQMGIGAGLNQQPMQGLFGNAGNQMPQANMMPTSNQSVQSFLNPNRFSDPNNPMATIGSGIGGLYF